MGLKQPLPYLSVEKSARKRKMAYDIGCGLGSFTSELAEHFEPVVGVDYAPIMIRRAKDFLPYNNVTYLLEDFIEIDIPTASVDLFAIIATLHHLPFESSLQKMKNTLRPGGKILILDLYQEDTIWDYLTIVVASIMNRVHKTLRHESSTTHKKSRRLGGNMLYTIPI